ncbi:MAG: LEA type 2 family protein, partial [Planctomycetes bacterium]|nr:LEA type 2 family protein [Planctomycetota bacterium]
ACNTLDALMGSGPKPTASLKGVRFGDLSFSKVGLDFDVEVTNPYEVPLPLLNLDYGLTTGRSQVLKGAAPLQGTIPAGQSKLLTLPAEVSILEVIRFVEGLRPGASVPYSADATLSVDAPILGKIPIPLTKQGELRIPSLPGL